MNKTRTLFATTTLMAFLFLSAERLASQEPQRYKSEVFSTYERLANIQYGLTATQIFDFYSGTGDTAKSRPLVIFIHGGGFKSGDKVSNFGTRVCGSLARRGYAVASINYRVTSSIPNDTVHFEAMLKAMQDAKAAVRFFRRYADQYGVDTSQIFATGSSAGSITALHMAYLDSVEVPAYVRWTMVGGAFELANGHAGYSSAIQGVISNWGAIGDVRWITSLDPPVFCVHGMDDVTIPYDSSFSDGPFGHGSAIIYNRAVDLAIPAGLRLFMNTGHTLDNNATKQDSAIKDFSDWLATILRAPTAVQRGETRIPEGPELRQNYPNPFNGGTFLEYRLFSDERVSLEVFDCNGRRIRSLVNAVQPAGVHRVNFDARGLASGTYFYGLTTSGWSQWRRMVYLQ